SDRPGCGPRLLHVAGDLRDELVLALKGTFVPEPAPQLDHEPAPVEVTVEIEQVRLDPSLRAPAVRVYADRHGATGAERCAGVDPEPGDEQIRGDVEIRRRKSQRPTALVSEDDDSLHLRRSAEEPRRTLDVARAQHLADRCRRRLLEQRNRADVEAEIAQKGRRSRRGATEAEVLADRDDARAESAENRFREVRRFEPGELGGELDDERLVHPLLPQQPEPPLERREELDAVPEDDARMRPERDHRRTQTGLLCDIEDCPVSDVHAVEAPERDAALRGFQLVASP